MLKNIKIAAISLMISLAVCVSSAQEKKKTITLSKDNTLLLEEDFNSMSVGQLMQKASELDANLPSGYPIYLFLYTPGGSIQAGLELFEYLSGMNRPVHTITLFAASMGFQAVQHLGDRYIVEYGVLMSHKARGSFAGEFGGTVSQLDSRYQLWLKRVEMMDKKTVERTNGKQTLKSYINAYTPELWLNGPEAVEKGYADEVVIVKCDSTMSGTRDIVVQYGFFRLLVTVSECPIRTGVISVSPMLATNKGWMSLNDFIVKNGSFKCEKETQKQTTVSSSTSRSWYSSGFEEPLPEKTEENVEKLCAQDSNLTLDFIKKKVQEYKEQRNDNVKNKVIYSY